MSENLESYALGLDIGHSLKNFGEGLDKDAIVEGLRTVLDGGEEKISGEEVKKHLQALQARVEGAKSEQMSGEGAAFLAENAQRSEVKVTETGLQYEVVTEGEGAKPTAEQTVEVNYEGKLIDGTIFDSSFQRGESISFGLNQVIKGWTEGLQLMTLGSTYNLYIPYSLGYGAQGAGQAIPPYAALVFKVELIAIK
jgi:FKBP-type peptidyl-prolyl cis-trans isomerase FklB